MLFFDVIWARRIVSRYYVVECVCVFRLKQPHGGYQLTMQTGDDQRVLTPTSLTGDLLAHVCHLLLLVFLLRMCVQWGG
jgi:hypothetical protein